MASVKAVAPLTTSSLSQGEGWGEGRVDQTRTIAENESEETDPAPEEKPWVSLTLTKLQEQQRLPMLRVSYDNVLKETEAVLLAILRADGKEVF